MLETTIQILLVLILPFAIVPIIFYIGTYILDRLPWSFRQRRYREFLQKCAYWSRRPE